VCVFSTAFVFRAMYAPKGGAVTRPGDIASKPGDDTWGKAYPPEIC
jgi:hypothetical protein